MEGDASRRLQGAFLEGSSRYLAISSPSTSAHLMTERLALDTEGKGTTTKGLRDNVCNACGTVMILGWNTATGKEQQARNAKQTRVRKSQRSYTQICKSCHRETITTLTVKSSVTKAGQPKSRAPTTTEPATEIPPTTKIRAAEKTSSKQRAKARKGKSGLEALLSKSKQMTGSSSTLNLMDFMKE